MNPSPRSLNLKDRLIGCFVGTAVGDTLGVPNEFLKPEEITPITADELYRGGGLFEYPSGAYSDDTSLMLCLANSLLERQGYDSMDVMYTYAKYMNEGYLSSVGYCADIGIGTMKAIDAFLEHTSAVYDSTRVRSNSAGNGCITRLAPIILAAYERRTSEELLNMARISVLDTHDSAEAEAVAMILTDMVYKALSCCNKEEILCRGYENDNPLYMQVYDELGEMIANKAEPHMLSGRAKDSLAIAVWGFYYGGNSFADGALWCANVGGDTDSQTATYGILAGAYYGLAGVPKHWITGLYNVESLKVTAEQLIDMTECPIVYTRFQEN